MYGKPAEVSRNPVVPRGDWTIGIGLTQPHADPGVQHTAMDDFECPFVDRYDARCAQHLTMGGLGYAYRHCFAEFASCPVYAELMAEEREPAARRRVEVTVHRKPLVPAAQAA